MKPTGSLRWSWLLWLAVFACADPDAIGDATDPGAAFADGPGARPGHSEPEPGISLRTITGTMIVDHVTAAGIESVPEDLSTYDISAIVPPAMTATMGTGRSDGTFEIPDVPQGTYILRLGTPVPVYVVTDRDVLDLGFESLSRPDAEPVTASPTNLVMNITGASPWQGGDQLSAFSAGAPLAAFAMQNGVSAGAPVSGATTLTGTTFDLRRASVHGLVDTAKGDSLQVAQLSTVTDGIHAYQALSRVFEPSSVQMSDGQTVTIDGAFSPVAPAHTVDFVWRRGEFDEALRTSVPPSSPDVPAFQSLVVHTLPEADALGFYAPSADVLTFTPGYTTDTSEVTGSWGYGDPYPAEWTKIVSARYATYRFVPAGDVSEAVFSTLEVDRLASDVTASAPMAPLIGPVQNARVNGESAYVPMTGVGRTPHLTWEPPMFGTPTGYGVIITRIDPIEGGETTLASFTTLSTELTLPPGILVDGDHHVFYVRARHVPGIELAANPFRNTLPAGSSQVASYPVSP